MGQPEITRSGNVSVGANTPRVSVQSPTIVAEESFGPVPEDNQPGHHTPDADPDKPFAKFAERFGRRPSPKRRKPAAKSNAAGRRKPKDGASPKTRKELYEEAKRKNIPGRSKMARDDLARALGHE